MVDTGYSEPEQRRPEMDALTLTLTLLVIFALVAIAAGAESREGFDRSDPGRSNGR